MNNQKIAQELVMLARELMSADTFKCPDCGTKVLEQTGFCVKCKKKVKKAAEMAADDVPESVKKAIKEFSGIAKKKLMDIGDAWGDISSAWVEADNAMYDDGVEMNDFKYLKQMKDMLNLAQVSLDEVMSNYMDAASEVGRMNP